MGILIDIKDLEKKYGDTTVLDKINLQLESGKIIGLLGPNGCGKTTLLKILNGLIKDYKGEVTIDGHLIGVESKQIISYLSDKDFLDKEKNAEELFRMYKRFYSDFDIDKARNMLKEFGLDVNKPMKAMSKGMQEKVQLSLVMGREAKIYMLDEPLGGVDPASREKILNMILKNYSEDALVIIATHLIHDVEVIFDSVLMIKEGKIAVNRAVDEIREETGKSVEEFFKEVF